MHRVTRTVETDRSAVPGVAEYDLVIVPDAPLADALNPRLERPQLGPFATRRDDERRDDERRVKAFLDGLSGELRVELETELRHESSRDIGYGVRVVVSN